MSQSKNEISRREFLEVGEAAIDLVIHIFRDHLDPYEIPVFAFVKPFSTGITTDSAYAGLW